MVGEKNMVGTASILEMSKLFRLERKKKKVDIFTVISGTEGSKCLLRLLI